MGATAMVANSTIRLSPGWNAIYYWGVWAICIICIAIILWAALKSPKWARWTTQDILIVAALGVLLEVYDNTTAATRRPAWTRSSARSCCPVTWASPSPRRSRS
jgi:hypothetical protein